MSEYQQKDWMFGEWQCMVAYDIALECYRGFATIYPPRPWTTETFQNCPPQQPSIQSSSKSFDIAVLELERRILLFGEEAKALCRK